MGQALRIRRSAAVATLLVAGAATPACYVTAPAPSYSDGYEPVYYEGNLVYYDDYGRPYYYGSGGALVWVGPSAPAYPRLTAHWHARPSAYRAWYAHQGYRYRGYRVHTR